MREIKIAEDRPKVEHYRARWKRGLAVRPKPTPCCQISTMFKINRILSKFSEINGTTSSSSLSSISILLSHPTKNSTGHPRCWLATQIQNINNTSFYLINFSPAWEDLISPLHPLPVL